MTRAARKLGLKPRALFADSEMLPQARGSLVPCGIRFTFQ